MEKTKSCQLSAISFQPEMPKKRTLTRITRRQRAVCRQLEKDGAASRTLPGFQPEKEKISQTAQKTVDFRKSTLPMRKDVTARYRRQK
jgi:hypothetical protein